MAFILQKDFSAQSMCMRGHIFTILAVGATAAIGIVSETASAREAEQADTTCKSQRRIIRPLTESTPIRKKDRDRVRRILM